MTILSRLTGIILISFCAFFYSGSINAVATGAEHQHHHDGQGDISLELNNGKKWETDAPLRQGMKKIHDEFLKYAPLFHNDTMSETDAQKLANEINFQLEFLIANCKLKAKADAVLHILIAELLQAVDVLKVKPLSMDGMPKIHKTLILYPEYFNHSGWGIN